MSAQVDLAAARATLDALLAALLELVAVLDHPVSPRVGVCFDQVVQLSRRLAQELGR